MSAITAPGTKISADPAKGSVLKNFQLAEDMTLGTTLAVAIDSNGKIVKADANGATALTRGAGILVAGSNIYGETSLASGSYGTVCLHGPVYGFSGLAEGTYVWMAKVAGGLEDTAPTDAYQHIMGQCVDADVLFVNPGSSTPTSA